MSNIAIKVENLGKRYRLGVKADKQETLAGNAFSWLKSPLANYRRLRSLSHFDDGETGDDVLWALKDVSFEVKQGEVLGIIGRNGAGKSTLLKILSRITPPTTGQITLNGRVASLLEVGTGFHPELTGRENVYLNGTILGMTKAEVDRKFDEIVDFSGVEKFIDTPVKRYSSGMNVRLAFSVAAYLEPEILLIDEVLAVGDVEFQKKSIGKMDEVSKSGRTVLFVSHNMTAIANLCQRVIVFDSGKIIADKTSKKGIEVYSGLNSTQFSPSSIKKQIAEIPGNEIIQLSNVRVFQKNKDRDSNTYSTSSSLFVEYEYEVKQSIHGLRVGFDLRCSDTHTTVFRTFFDDSGDFNRTIVPGYYCSVAELPPNFLAAKSYYLSISIGIHNIRWIIHEQLFLPFQMENLDGVNSHYADRNRPGLVMPLISWDTIVVN